MSTYRKKPVEIEARQWAERDHVEWLADWIEEHGQRVDYDPDISGPSGPDGSDWGHFAIDTLEGEMQVTPMDFIIRGVQGEFYPCKPDIFAATYELVVS